MLHALIGTPHAREDDGILAEVMVAEAGPDNGDKGDPVLEHFVELRKYIELSHDGLSGRLGKVEGRLGKVEGRLEGVEGRLEKVEGRLEKVEAGQQRLERKVDAGFDRLGRKIDALASTRRVTPRRRKP